MGHLPSPADHVVRNECCTPDAVYGTDVGARRVVMDVTIMEGLLPREDEGRLVAELHAAILPVFERIYRDNWAALAGRFTYQGDKPLPARWEDLDPQRFRALLDDHTRRDDASDDTGGR